MKPRSARRFRTKARRRAASPRLELLTLENRLLPGNTLSGVFEGFARAESRPVLGDQPGGASPGSGAITLLAASESGAAPAGDQDARFPAFTPTKSSFSSSETPAPDQPRVGSRASGIPEAFVSWNGVDDPLSQLLPEAWDQPAEARMRRFHARSNELPARSTLDDASPGGAGPSGNRGPELERAPAPVQSKAAGFDALMLVVLNLPGEGGGSNEPTSPGGPLPPALVPASADSCACGIVQGCATGNPDRVSSPGVGQGSVCGIHFNDANADGWFQASQGCAWSRKPTISAPGVQDNGDPGTNLYSEETTAISLSAYGTVNDFLAQSANPCSSGLVYSGTISLPRQLREEIGASLTITAPGVNGGKPAGLDVSPANVRYIDGTVRLSTTDLQSAGFGIPWGQTRSWSNNPGYAPINLNGTGTVVIEFPTLRQVVGGSDNQIVLTTSGTNALYFDRNGTIYVPRFFDQEQLRHQGNTFVLIDTTGDVLHFADFTAPPFLAGKFLGVEDRDGNGTVVQYRPDGKPDTVIRSDTNGGVTTTELYHYFYLNGGINNGLLQGIQMVHQVTGQPDALVRQVVYTYYDGSRQHGNPGDLESARIEDASGNVLDTKYYRYYTGEAGGLIHDLKSVFNPQSFARMLAGLQIHPQPDPLPILATLADQVVNPYADNSFTYDPQNRVSQEVAQGVGCSSCSGGQGTFSYSYLPSGFQIGFNNWNVRTDETLPDGNRNIVYSNAYGEPMLKIFHDQVSNQEWATSYQYDENGRLVRVATPAAVRGYNDHQADLSITLSDNGLIQLYTYYGSTNATETMAGSVAGYLQNVQLQRGPGNVPVPQQSFQYYLHVHRGGLGTVSPVGISTVYRDVLGQVEETTRYSYVWMGQTAQVQTVTVTNPPVSAAQNGPGTPDVTTANYDGYGRMVMTTDPDGFITTNRYDVATGAATQTVVDVGAGPGHLNLTTTMVVDDLGRTTQLTDPNGNITYTVYNDPNHEVRVYAGWQGTTPTGPTQVVREDRGHSPSYVETLTMSAPPHLTGGRPDGTEAIDNLQTLARTFTSPGGQVVESDAYFNLTGLVYSTNPTLGTAGINFYPTLNRFDHRGRLNRVVSPTGTIARTVYDGLGRVVSAWTGTNDSGATDDDPSGGGDPNNNMTRVSLNVYDGSGDVGGVGDSNLTRMTQFPNDGTPNRVTDYFYDWRDRRVAVKSGVQDGGEDTTTHRPITYTEFDNLDEAIAREQYDGDGITVNIGSDGVPVKPPAILLRSRSTSEYDDRGRVFRAHLFSVDQANGTISPTSLTTNQWYDHRGNLIKISAPGGLVTKTQYDGAGRAIKSFNTDGAGDVTWADARTILPTNTVLTQIETQYDSNGNSIFVISKARFHDATSTGELNHATARFSYFASYYDRANRMAATVDVGTNGGTDYSRPPTVPPRSDTVLVTSQTYNPAGWVQDVTDPRGLNTRTLYDNLRRTTKNIEDYTDGVPTNSTNRTTQFTYDGSGHVLTQTAVLPMGMVQTTQSVYGVTSAGGSNLSSNDLVAMIKYPDKTTGLPSDNPADQESFSYNALGQQKAKTDRNGTVHTYSYDVLGRPTADAVTTLGLGVDGHVQALQTAYDTGGRPYLYTSYDAPSAGNIVNQVQQVYNGLGQLTAEYQFHGDPAVTTPGVVQYTYSEMAGGANHSRPVSMTYPNGRVLHYGYNPGLDDSISRLSFLADDDGSGGSGTHLEEYSYLGLNTVVKRAHPESGVDLTYIKLNTEPNGDAGDQYTGLDRFGRVVDQRWLPPANPQSATDRFQYSYDPNGNRLSRSNLVNPAFSEQNGYDALNRLTSFAQGSHTQGWNLDSLGNWNTVTTDGTPQNRSHNQQNQITSISPPSTPPVYDNNGNTTIDDTGQTYVYDAWNRQVQVQDAAGNSLANYTYDALGRRVQEIENNFFGNPVTRDLYFSTQWQVLEEQETDSSGNTLVRAQNVWSPVYVDAMILRDRDPVSGGSGSLSERLYVQQDANWNVTGLIDTTGTVQERYVYDPYGRATVVDPNTWLGIGASQFNWVYLHQGGRYDNASGLYNFRDRDYSPTLGRWMQQDPVGYVGGMNLFQYVGSRPTSLVDPYGEFQGGADWTHVFPDDWHSSIDYYSRRILKFEYIPRGCEDCTCTATVAIESVTYSFLGFGPSYTWTCIVVQADCTGFCPEHHMTLYTGCKKTLGGKVSRSEALEQTGIEGAHFEVRWNRAP